MQMTETVLLDELRLVVVVDNESDTLSSIDPGIPQLPEAATPLMSRPVVREFEGHPAKQVFDELCCACHGFSVLATGRVGDEEHTALFDVGPYGDVWLRNARYLGIELAKIEVVFLSHWHFDHSGGLPEVVAAIAAARSAAGLSEPLVADLHPDRPDQRGILLPNGVMALLPGEPSFEAIQAAGARVARNADAHAVASGFFFGSGEIERVTSYETGLAGHHSFRGDDGEPDPLILDERFLAAQVRNRGVTVLSACSHAGVVNACLAAAKASDDTPIDLVLGGYHLSGKAMETRIPETVRDLSERVQPTLVSPGHCTGWRAKAALADAFAPGRYAPSVVGSRFVLTADD